MIDLFLDSGAFSAFTQGVEIDIDEYIKFIKQHEDYLETYAVLDVIGDPIATYKNQKYMEKKGVMPLPCFHYGEDPKWLKKYLDEGHEYIALGGMVPISTGDLRVWLDAIFSKYLCDDSGKAIVKVHGFGLTSLPLMVRYPWYSVDSTSWVVASRMGYVYIPRIRDGEYQYGQDAWKVAVSAKSPSKADAGAHIDTFPPKQKAIILEYLKDKGYPLGKSEFKYESHDYELAENEKWSESKKATKDNPKRKVEILHEVGLCNSYNMRDELNIIYFIDLGKALPDWPDGRFTAGSKKRSAGLGL